MRSRFGRWSTLATVAALSGCTSTIVKLEDANPCPVASPVLAEQCAEPAVLADGATYANVVAASQSDRGHLKACAAHDELLRQAIASCNASIAKHNEAVREINQRYAAKP